MYCMILVVISLKSDSYICKFIDDGTASESTVTGRAIRERQEQASSAAMTAGQAETVLDVMEQESKLR